MKSGHPGKREHGDSGNERNCHLGKDKSGHVGKREYQPFWK